MGKPTICIGENTYSKADQRLCFRYSDSIISLLPKSEISSFYPFSVLVQLGLCQTWSETPKTVFSRRGSIDVFYIMGKSISQIVRVNDNQEFTFQS